MARPSKGSPIEGGYFITGAKRLLDDKKLLESGLRGEFWACLAVMQLINPWEGRFEHASIPFEAETICKRASIKKESFQELLNGGWIQRDSQGVLFIPKWVEYQSPKTKTIAKQRKQKEPLNGELKEPLKESTKVPESLIINPKSVILNPNHTADNKASGNGGSNQIPKDIQRRIDKIDEYHQMLQNPKYGSDQCEQFKACIKMLEAQIDEINKRNGHQSPITDVGF